MSEYVDDPRLSDAANAKWREIMRWANAMERAAEVLSEKVTESDRALTFSDLFGILEPNPNLPDCPSRIVPVLPDTRGYGVHIRGDVFRSFEERTWAFVVFAKDHELHSVVAGDNCYRSQAEAFAACEFAVAAAREAWMRGFGRRARGLR